MSVELDPVELGFKRKPLRSSEHTRKVAKLGRTVSVRGLPDTPPQEPPLRSGRIQGKSTQKRPA